MTAWKRWQDFATMAFGVLLFISPFVFGETSHEVAARSAYVFGVLLVLAGALAAATRDGRRSLFLNAPGFVSVVTFVSPWVLRFSGVTGIAWTAWVVGIATVLVAASLPGTRRTRVRTA
ncbi:MAG: hypothetical protein JWM18_1232 [Chloroflexi bacterium]|jgi:uncharacterized membrane protein HdeD (DUF308 family)|nr:hypothetical protein [Chloroflexota bacterium]